MELNKRKFNIIVIFTVCLMCTVFVFSAIDFSSLTDIGLPHADSEFGDEADYDEETDDLENEMEEGNTVEAAPIFTAKTKWNALNFALSNLNKYDYKMTLKQTVAGQALGISGKQSIDKVLYKTSGNYYSKIIAKGSGPNFIDYSFTDADTSIITNRNNGNNIASSYDSYLAKYGLSPDRLTYEISAATATIDSFDYDHPIKRKYYVLKVTLKPQAYAKYLKYMEINAGSGSNPEMKAITLTIKIDIKYGRISSIAAQEDYKINQMGVRATCDSKVTYTFKYGDYSSESEFTEIKNVIGK